MAEDGGSVEWAVILREVQPALEAVRALTTHTNANDVRRAADTKSQLLHLGASLYRKGHLLRQASLWVARQMQQAVTNSAHL